MKKKRVNKSEERENIQRGGEIEGFLKHFVMSKVNERLTHCAFPKIETHIAKKYIFANFDFVNILRFRF